MQGDDIGTLPALFVFEIILKKLLTEMSYSANIYIVVAAIHQMLITCWVSADNNLENISKKFLTKGTG